MSERDVRHLNPGTRRIEYGVALDDLGSVDVYPTYDEAADAFRRDGGIGLVQIETSVLAYELPTHPAPPTFPAPVHRPARACGLCRCYGHEDDDCPTNPATWPIPPASDQGADR